ncbi:MAG: nicotinate-nicotinamide nucleotide adenylyltransferase [Gammaproteobacteria bacterium]|nr:nicotinate-nicotinamide nucleotide adenylyltransferase [Gammaproteobacteria bacterium]
MADFENIINEIIEQLRLQEQPDLNLETALGLLQTQGVLEEKSITSLLDLAMTRPVSFLLPVINLGTEMSVALDDQRIDLAMIKHAKALLKKNKHSQQEVAIFGSSFNPTTLGHIALIRTLLNQAYDRVRLIPAGQSPLKPISDYAPITDRLNLLDMALQSELKPLERARLWIESIETDRQPPSSMVITLAALTVIHQAQEHYSLILGYDHLAQMDQWYLWASLQGLCELIFYPREEIDIFTNTHVACLHKLIEAGIAIKIVFCDAEKKSEFYQYCDQCLPKKALIFDKDAQIVPSSATTIRAYYKDRAGEQLSPSGLTPEMHHYILSHHLFSNSANITEKKNNKTKDTTQIPPGTR